MPSPAQHRKAVKTTMWTGDLYFIPHRVRGRSLYHTTYQKRNTSSPAHLPQGASQPTRVELVAAGHPGAMSISIMPASCAPAPCRTRLANGMERASGMADIAIRTHHLTR